MSSILQRNKRLTFVFPTIDDSVVDLTETINGFIFYIKREKDFNKGFPGY